MAEFRKLPTQAELQNMLFMEQMQVKTPQQIAQEALASGTTVTPIPENVFQKIAGGAGIAKEYVNRAGSAADLAKLFPGYKPETKVTIPTGYNFAPKQAPTGEIIPGGLQTQNVNLGQVLGAIKPADVLGLTGFEKAYTDVGLGKAPQPLDVLDVAAVGYLPAKAAMSSARIGKAVLSVGKNLPIGLSIKDVSKTGGLLTEAPRSPLGFYSALEESALNLQRNKGSGQAFLNDLQKAPNVKADEIKWTGLDEFLKTKPNVTKQEVQDYLANNRVEVQEVQLGAGTVKSFEQWAADQGLTPEAIRAYEPSLRNSYEAFKNSASQKVGAAKFGQYTLPGGENYREILLTMPNVKGGGLTAEEVERLNILVDKRVGSSLAGLNDAEQKEYFSLIKKREQSASGYKSAHFDQPNILAHLRVNDRVDADGKKMLLVEEVQSDWHQAGREKGYRALPEGAKIIEQDGWYEVQRKDGRLLGNGGNTAEEAKASAIDFLSGDRVPDAPFKDSWYQLALKRAIQYAAENGYDRIGLTTGSQQAARFDLSKQVDELNYKKNADGTYKLSAQAGGMGNMIGEAIPESKLADYVGKEVAQKIIDNVGSEVNFGGSGSVSQPKDIWKGLSGIDLKIGGEGMKKYYDEIYPKFLDKYGKKWGARVGEGKLQGTVSKDELAAKVYGMGETYKNLPSELKRKIDQMYMGSGETVRYLDVTPEMKASVSKGQPLFQALPAIPATGLLATQDEER